MQIGTGDTINLYHPYTYALLGQAAVSGAPVSVGEPAGLPYPVDAVLFNGQQFGADLFFQVRTQRHGTGLKFQRPDSSPSPALPASTRARTRASARSASSWFPACPACCQRLRCAAPRPWRRQADRGAVHVRAQIPLTSWPSSFNSAPFNALVSVPTRTGSGAQFIGNTFKDNRGRAISLQTGNAVIQGNTIINQGPNVGITVGPNINYGESDYGSNILVRSQPYIVNPHPASKDSHDACPISADYSHTVPAQLLTLTPLQPVIVAASKLQPHNLSMHL